jgi:hypothetical protein
MHNESLHKGYKMYLPDEKWPWTQGASCVPIKYMNAEVSKMIYHKNGSANEER